MTKALNAFFDGFASAFLLNQEVIESASKKVVASYKCEPVMFLSHLCGGELAQLVEQPSMNFLSHLCGGEHS